MIFFATLVAMVLVEGCIAEKAQPPFPATKPRSARVRPVDQEAQQFHYDQGLKYYTDENYRAAKKAFQRAIEFGVDTPLAGRARENLTKTERVLNTLEEMENK